MTAGAAIFARLSGQTSAGGRVYPEILPQQPTVPAVTYTQVSAVRTHAMGRDGEIIRIRMQLDCWARSYAEAQTLAAEVEARLSRFRGQAGGATVLDALLDNQLETYEPDTQLRRVTQDYTVFLAR